MIYLDNNATTPLDPAVAEKMSQFIKEHFGNPSSLYPIGRKVKEIITEAREVIAKAIGAVRTEIIITAGCSMAEVIISFFSGKASRTPRMARLSASVPDPVKIISVLTAPMALAMTSRASVIISLTFLPIG